MSADLWLATILTYINLHAAWLATNECWFMVGFILTWSLSLSRVSPHLHSGILNNDVFIFKFEQFRDRSRSSFTATDYRGEVRITTTLPVPCSGLENQAKISGHDLARKAEFNMGFKLPKLWMSPESLKFKIRQWYPATLLECNSPLNLHLQWRVTYKAYRAFVVHPLRTLTSVRKTCRHRTRDLNKASNNRTRFSIKLHQHLQKQNAQTMCKTSGQNSCQFYTITKPKEICSQTPKTTRTGSKV